VRKRGPVDKGRVALKTIILAVTFLGTIYILLMFLAVEECRADWNPLDCDDLDLRTVVPAPKAN
jgi:hypothetical protein